MACAEVRDLLSEHALGTLDQATRARVEQHLVWCAGCRKESSELAEGVAGLGLSLPPAEPLGSLEERVVAAVGARARSPRRRRGVAAVLVAALVGGSLVWGVATAGREQPADPRLSAQDTLKALGSFEELYERLAGDEGVDSLRFRPVRGGPARGGATRYTTADGPAHSLMVLVGGLPSGRAPYTVVLRSEGATMVAGTLEVSGEGQHGLIAEFARPLAGFDQVVVEDADGRRVLVGTFSR
jgi:hypothetical protein